MRSDLFVLLAEEPNPISPIDKVVLVISIVRMHGHFARDIFRS